MNSFTFRTNILSCFILFLLHSSVKAQPDYSFKNPVLVSGSGLQQGAKYKFSNVKPGIDAFITLLLRPGASD